MWDFQKRHTKGTSFFVFTFPVELSLTTNNEPLIQRGQLLAVVMHETRKICTNSKRGSWHVFIIIFDLSKVNSNSFKLVKSSTTTKKKE